MTTTNTLLNEVNIYVGTYAKYNTGSIGGEWLCLGNYSDLEDFYNACKELHADESDPEFMFQDFEVPDFLKGKISEYGIDLDIFEVAENLEVFEGFNDSDWINAHNEYCDIQNYEERIYDFDDEFFNLYFDGRPMEAARAASFGNLNWSDDYIYFDAYSNLQSTNNPDDLIDRKSIIEAYLEMPSNFNF